MFNTSIGCPLLGYLLNVCTNLSAWCITAFTVERFVVVYYPLQRASICTHKQTRRVLVALLPYPLLINIYTLVTLRLQPHDGRCETSPSFARVHQLLGLLDTSVCFGLPVVTICVLNTLIALKVWAYSRQAEVLWAGQRGPHSAVETMAKERSITRVLLVVSGTFALLNLPAYIIRSKAQLVVALGRLDLWTDWDESLEQMAYFLYYSNFAINFLLYCMSSRNFRTAARRTFLPCTQARKSLQVTLSQSRSGRSTISQTMPLTSIN